jgi:hypothetical protein
VAGGPRKHAGLLGGIGLYLLGAWKKAVCATIEFHFASQNLTGRRAPQARSTKNLFPEASPEKTF